VPQPELSQEELLRRITNRIRQSLELEEILDATVAELRSLLGTDRVIVYRFHESGSGEVIAESIQDNCLPSLKGLNFPADDIPEKARQKYLETRLCSFVDVSLERIGWLPVDCCITGEDTTPLEDIVEYRPVDPCHVAYLTAMGVQSSVALPILHNDIQSQQAKEQLWGLLVSHNTQLRVISRRELQVMQWAIDQVAIAIAQSNLLAQARQQHFVEATTNRVATLLHSLPTIELQAALEETVAALEGCGGRLYIAPYTTTETAELYSSGTQPASFDDSTGNFIEQHPVFAAWVAGHEANSADRSLKSSAIPNTRKLPFSPSCAPLGVTDLYSTPELQPLTPAFRPTIIRGMLVVSLYYRSSFLGYLTIFRPEINTETLWAGRFDPSEKQQLPRQSFEVWRELKRGHSKEWARQDIELAIALAHHLAMAVEQYELYSMVHSLNANLERQVEERTAKLQQSLERGRALERVTNQIRSTLDLNTILQTIVREVRNLLGVDRVVIYQFAEVEELKVGALNVEGDAPKIAKDALSPSNGQPSDPQPATFASRGRVIVESKSNDCLSTLDISDPHGYFLGPQTRPYKRARARVISDVSRAPLAPARRAFFQSFQIEAALIVPIGVGAHHSHDLLSYTCAHPAPHTQGEQPLWGLLIAQECHAPRSWQAFEIDLLQQLADQAAVAIQQAELYERSCMAAATATARAKQLAIAAQQQQALFGVVTKIRESLDVNAIFKATTTEVRRLLGADRVAVFRFAPECGYDCGAFVSEDVRGGFPEASCEIQDYCFGEKYRPGWVQAIPDIRKASLNECHLKILEQLQARASLVVPLPKGEALWGLLCIHQCTAPRRWDNSEIEFARQIAAHLGIALQQAELLQEKQQQTEQLAIALDHLKQTQTKLIQTEKMSSLGQLVAGVAHEINNPVNFIYGNLTYTNQYAHDLLNLLHLYQKYYPRPTPEIVEFAQAIDLEFLNEDLPKILTSMRIGSERIRNLVLSLRNFSRLDQAEMKPVDIHEGIDSTLLILQHRLKVKPNAAGIEIIKTYGKLPLVECYASQLNQVFMNVLSNAIDALEEYNTTRTLEEINSNKSQITISTSVQEVNPQGRSNKSGETSPFSSPPDDRVVIQIADNGPGISPALQSQIFDPFFTTKPIGKGTGLGLAISYQIVVEKHGGVFRCDSQPGEGTMFWIEIPVRQPSSSQQRSLIAS
jgi:GAF domain-containing protein